MVFSWFTDTFSIFVGRDDYDRYQAHISLSWGQRKEPKEWEPLHRSHLKFSWNWLPILIWVDDPDGWWLPTWAGHWTGRQHYLDGWKWLHRFRFNREAYV